MFKSVSRYELTKAFALSHRMAERCTIPQYKQRFRQIATLIWKSCGEEGKMPASLPAELEQLASEATWPTEKV